MEEVLWGVAIILGLFLGLILGGRSDRRTSNGTKSDIGRIRDGVERTGDDNQQLRDDVQRAGDDNQRAQQLVGRAREILSNARHTDDSN